MADRSLVMLITIRTQVGISKSSKMMAKKKKPSKMKLDAIPAHTSRVQSLHIKRASYA